ncbi:MAG: RimK family alpha-L-glutamate ligase [Planctomycetaceae bacterium]|nr:RimK family alpha-L-glutamate ligase [Planctomycetaceae bacterium]
MRLAILASADSGYYRDLTRAAGDHGHHVERWDFPQIIGSIRTGGETFHVGEAAASDVDAIIVRTMPPGSLEQVVVRMDWLARLEARGVRVINPPKSLECAVDKYLTTSRLTAAGLPVPDTIVCESPEAALLALDQLGGDVVVKPLFGAEGRGIVRVSDPDIGQRVFFTLSRMQSVLYLQRFIDHGGSDVRVLVLDGKVLGGMRRIAENDFRTNVSRQARGESHQPTATEIDWALRATAATGAIFAGVDILYDRLGHGYVIEVNAVPGWKAFARANQINIADVFIQWLMH